ncbi:MAG: Spx/MgsR family RNA polymerase-binding regulatory protein [Pseudomonadota bacterium]
MKIYGIKSCDGCRKARRFLDEIERDHQWTDLREDGVDEATIQRWLDVLGAETLVNRRSTTWRGLDEQQREQAMAKTSAANLLAAHPTLIKRPVFEIDGELSVGFTPAIQDRLRG